MIQPERIPIGILTQNEGKFAAAAHAIDEKVFDVIQITDDHPEIQAPTSLEVAAFSARRAAQDYGISIIREDHSMHFDGLNGLPGPYAKYAEECLGITGLLGVIAGSSRSGSYITSAALCDPCGNTVGTSSRVGFSVASEPRGDLQQGWPQLIKIEGEERTLAEYPEEERLHGWSTNYRRLSDFMRWRQNRVIYITGPHAAGKTEAARSLLEEHGYPYLDLGPTIRQVHVDSGSSASLGSWIDEQEITHGSDFTDSLLSAHAADSRARQPHPFGFAVIGSRSVDGLVYIDTVLDSSDSLHLHVNASEQLLHSRFCKREQRQLTEEEFAAKLASDEDMGLNGLRGVADHVIQNDGDMEALHATVSNAIGAWKFILPSDDLVYID